MLPSTIFAFRACVFSMLFCLFSKGDCAGYYKVIGPRVIRPNSEFHVAISTQANSQPTSVNVSIYGQSYSRKSYYFDDSVSVEPYTTRISRIMVGDIEPGHYKLLVTGEGGVDFNTEKPLSYVRKSYSIFIQTDKSVYKPGHLILFRAIVLNSNLKPAAEVRNEPLNIHISDGEGNKVKEWKSVTAPRGVFSGELQLSNGPVLGNWNISVTIHRQTFNKTIEVAAYVFPKFLIDIKAPRHITFQENILTVNIESRYDYGKKVQGDATVTVYPTIYSGVIQPIYQNPIRKVMSVDGSATVNFDIAKELNLNDEYERIVVVDVTIEEALTGRRQNNSVEVQLHKYDYKMELIKTADYYKPGMRYVAYVKVSNHDSSPIQNDRNTVKVRYGYSRVDEIYVEEFHKLNKFGVARLELYPPVNSTNQTALRIEAEYYDLKERISPVPAAVSPSNTFLQVTLETDRPIVNLDVDVHVNCTEPMKYITYELMGRGDVIIANTFQTDSRRVYRFRFTATHAMVPVSHLLVSYVRDSGELVSDSLDIEIDGLLQNFIDIQTNIVEAQPEMDVDLTIRAQPNSYIGLLAVDENVGLLRNGYDIIPKEVSDELLRYDPSLPSPYGGIMRNQKSHFFWKPGSSNTRDMFYDSGASLLTNSKVNAYRPTLEDVYLRPVSYDTSTVKSDRGVGLFFHTVTRPPLAGPYAFSRIPRPVWDTPKVYLSQNIFDTWLFTNFSSGFEGKTTIRRRIPNSLNNWLITGFSLDPLHGLGLVTSPKQLTVTKQFVVTINLPYSIQRGEILAVPIVIYNHLERDITAEVVLHNPEQRFEFAEMSNEINATRKIELYRRKRLRVNKNSGGSVSFMITPMKIGLTELKVTASSSNMQDSVIKHLRVQAEGETQYNSKSLLIDLRKTPNFKGNITVDIPKNFVAGSENIEISAVGDLLGSVIINLERLIRLPTGCGEQNLVEFVPNLIILNYLRNTGQLAPTVEKDAIKNLETSYQKQLSYKRKDDSFSAFGNRDDKGSIWITSYTTLSLIQARPYIYIDENIISKALEWLANNQAANGSFVEVGKIIHQDAQSREGNSLALTAFTLMAFIENRKQTSVYTNVINKGLDYIARNIDENEEIYSIALASYVLQLANHPSKLSAFNLLDSKGRTAADLKWWGKDTPKDETNNPWNSLPKSIDIETTSYALLTFLEADLIDDAIPVVNWLVKQGSNLGGFTSSQDTQIGLFALYKLVMRLSANSNMQIEFQYRRQEINKFSINQNTALIVQKEKIGNDARVINVTAQGTGIALLRVGYNYNMNVTGPWPMFTLDPQVDRNSNQHHLQLSICTGFVSRNLTEVSASNMAVMEVNLPSGFTADYDSLPSLEVSQNVQKVETKNGDTTVVLYFNNLTRQEYCPTVSAFRTHKVAKEKPAAVIIYDYYDSSRRARIFYRGRMATLCDICEGEDCGDICTSEPNVQQIKEENDENGKGSSNSIYPNVINVILIFVFVTYTNRS